MEELPAEVVSDTGEPLVDNATTSRARGEINREACAKGLDHDRTRERGTAATRDIRASRPYFLTSQPVSAFVRRAGSVIALLLLDVQA